MFLKVSKIPHKNTWVGVSFFIKNMKLYTGICSAWISCTSAEIFFPIDWHHKHQKNAIDLLLFYGEHCYGFSESDFKNIEKNPFISQQTSINKGHRHFEVLWSFIFCTYFKGLLCPQKTVIMLIFPCICIKHSQH